MTTSETQKIRLTGAYCEKAKYRHPAGTGKRDIRWDKALPGFGLRVYPSGNKAYVIGYRTTDNHWKMKTVGAYGVEPIAAVRDQARIELAEVVKGHDPLEQKREKARGDTVEEFTKVYIRRHASVHKKSVKADQSMVDNIIVPAFGKRKLKLIKRNDIAKLHQKLGERVNPKTGKPSIAQANRVLSLWSKMFNLAEQWGHVPEGFSNPARGIQKFKETARDRWVTHEELPILTKAIDAEKNTVARDALWLYLLTGLRRNELLMLKWTDVDLNRAEVRLSDTKAGRAHYLPLSPPAVELLRDMVRLTGNPYVFPGMVEGHHLVNISKAWLRVRKDAKIEDVKLHDLRRTVGSWLAQSGNTLHLIGKVLNHSNPSTTQVYARFGQDSVRLALDQHGEQIMGAAGKIKAAEVVPLRKSTSK